MAIALVTTKQWDGGGYVQTSGSGSFTATAGNLIVLGIAKGLAGAWVTPTDSLGNTYTLMAAGGTDNDASLYYAKNIAGGSCTITLSSAPDFQDQGERILTVKNLK